MPKGFFTLFLVLVLLLLDFAALDDITTGNEVALAGEYLSLFLTFPIFGYILGNLWLFLAYTYKKEVTRFTHLMGYHFHHSLLGMLMLIGAFLIYPPWLSIVVAGLGVGIFIHHTITEGLIFIAKD